MKKTGKRFLVLLLVVFSLFAFAAPASAAKVKLNKTSITLTVGKKYTLKVKGIKKKAKWSTSNKKIAAVNSKGIVTAKKKGNCTITAKIGKKKYKCKVTVKAKTKKKNPKPSPQPDPKPDPAPTPEPEPTKYGSVSGNITYHYNKYRGYVPDTNAYVFLVPRDGSAKSYHETILTNSEDVRIYYTNADGMGNYTFSRVPVGAYYVIYISRNATSEGYFNATSYDEYEQNIVNVWSAEILSTETAKSLAFFMFMYQHDDDAIYVYENTTTTSSKAFSYTYI